MNFEQFGGGAVGGLIVIWVAGGISELDGKWITISSVAWSVCCAAFGIAAMCTHSFMQ